MPRPSLSELDTLHFDVAVVGAGVNGASAAHHLAADGYRVLIVDRKDFASGASSRSGRLLHCGLRYLEPGEGLGYKRPSIWDLLLKPRETLHNFGRARDAMHTRNQIARSMPERLNVITEFFPVWSDDQFPAWSVGLGLRLLAKLGPPGGLPLEARRYGATELRAHEFLGALRDQDELKAAFSYAEYQFNWSERIVMDTLLDAERLDAVVRNYTEVVSMERVGEMWTLTLQDNAGESARVTITAKAIINAAGAWTDKVSRSSKRDVRQRVQHTKGAHIVVRLPPQWAKFGICTYTRDRVPIYAQPWRGMHYIGPTDTLHDGDIENPHATEEEVKHLLDETNRLFPSLHLSRNDVLHTYAGIRPMTYAADQPMGTRGHTLHDLESDGMPNVYALTSGPILSHRLAGQKLRDAVKRKIAPSGKSAAISYGAKLFPSSPESPALLNHWPHVCIADLRYSAEHEQPTNLVDLLFRRVGAGWTETMAREGARVAAEAVADILQWDRTRVDQEVDDYLEYTATIHGFQSDQS